MAKVKDSWDVPDMDCPECGKKGRPVLYIDFDQSAHPYLGCECGHLDGQAIVLDWPFEGRANKNDFMELGFIIV